MTQDSDRSLEIVILLIFGTFTLIFGVLLFKIQDGSLPYNSNSAFGLFLVLLAFQVITMGKTPYGDFRRSWALVIIGIVAAFVGMSACFLPGFYPDAARILTGVILLTGGLTLLLQLLLSERRARLWIRIGGLLIHLTIACALVYALTALAGLITLVSGLTTLTQTGIILIVYGASFFYLAACLRGIPAENRPETAQLASEAQPNERSGLFREVSLSLSEAILVLMGILLTFFGLLLFPVNLGLLAFSPDGQLGLLLTLMAIQAMALGDTPFGQFRRSPFIIIVGFIFAALGIVSSIVPGLLTGMIAILVGLLNLVSGGTSLIKRFLPKPQETAAPSPAPVAVPPDVQKLIATQTAASCFALGFGVSTLLPGLVPGPVMAAILVVFGLLMFRLVILLRKLAKLQSTLA